MINLFKKFLKSEKGDTNIISLIVLLGVIVIAVIIFKPYIAKLFFWFFGLFS